MQMSDDGGTVYALDSGTLRLRHIELDLPDGERCADVADSLVGAECDDGDSDDKIRIAGPFTVDLVTGTSMPSLADVVVPAGNYARVDFRVEDGPDDSAFAVAAAFEHDGEALSLALTLDFNEDIRIEAPAGVSIDADSDLIAEFVIDNWLAGVDIGACIAEGDVGREGDVVFVDDSSTSGSCSDIEDTIKRNMKLSGQLDRD